MTREVFHHLEGVEEFVVRRGCRDGLAYMHMIQDLSSTDA